MKARTSDLLVDLWRFWFWRGILWVMLKANGCVHFHVSLSHTTDRRTAKGKADIYRDCCRMLWAMKHGKDITRDIL